MSLIEAARAALRYIEDDGDGDTTLADALRTALAEAEKAQPVAYRYRYWDGWRFSGGAPVNGCGPIEAQALYAAPQPVSESRDWKADFGEMQAHCADLETELRHLRKAQPVAVPTAEQINAVMKPCDDSEIGRHLRRGFIESFQRVYASLAAAPAVPAPQPLTDAALRQLAYDTDAAGNSVIEYGRAIERAHGIC